MQIESYSDENFGSRDSYRHFSTALEQSNTKEIKYYYLLYICDVIKQNESELANIEF